MPTINVNTDADRDYVSSVIRSNDKVRVGDMDEYQWCDVCDEQIGIDYDMYDLEGCVLYVEHMRPDYNEHLSCGAKVFSAEGWLWSTCWIDRFYPHMQPAPSWEV